MSTETIDIGTVEITREDVREYRKTATVRAGKAIRGGVMPTLEGDHSFEAGDYIAGPGAAGEFWPVKRAIFEATYAALPDAEQAGAQGDDRRRPYRAAIGADAIVVRADGSKIIFGDAIYHPENVAEAKAYAAQPAAAAIDDLGAAWAEAEAVLPEGWSLTSLVLIGLRTHAYGHEGHWQAWAEDRSGGLTDEAWDAAYGPTPAAALHNLAARLAADAPQPEEER